MRTTFNAGGGGGCTQPADPPRVRRRARLALIIVLLIMAFALGTLIAVAWEALSDMDAHGEMDPTWEGPALSPGFWASLTAVASRW
jgi:hypothetical protein